ncbi:MAG: cobalamin-binding protein [Candidatus Aenigmarchaeota archaeon]|nr:cobalamin-binding protein [Candidatus Aenigmarchaeota archaeon]
MTGIRIISLAPSNTEILFSLGLGPQVVGVTRFCDYPDEAKKITKIGGWVDPEYGRVESLKPDLIFTSTFLQEKIAKALSAKGFNVVHTDPKNLGGVYESIITIGKSCHKLKESKTLVGEIMNGLDGVKQIFDEPVKVYCEEWHRPPTVSGNWVPDIIRIAGGESMIKAGEISRETTLQEVAKFGPEIIVVSLCGFGEKSDKRFILQRPGWQNLDAVKNNKIIVMDDSLLNRPGPRLVNAAEKLAAILDQTRSRGINDATNGYLAQNLQK